MAVYLKQTNEILVLNFRQEKYEGNYSLVPPHAANLFLAKASGGPKSTDHNQIL